MDFFFFFSLKMLMNLQTEVQIGNPATEPRCPQHSCSSPASELGCLWDALCSGSPVLILAVHLLT